MPSTVLSRIVIECILSKDNEELTGEGCIYDLSSPSPTISQPWDLHPGDYVKLRLWLPDESICIFVELAEVQWVQHHWIKVDILMTSPGDQARLRQFVSFGEQPSPAVRRESEQIVIHA